MRKKRVLIVLTVLVLCLGLLSGCGSSSNNNAANNTENTNAADGNAAENRNTADTNVSENAENTELDFSSIAGIYYSKLAMSDTMSVDLYLTISEDGSFKFTRNTDSDAEDKGSGKLGNTDEGMTAFIYSVVAGEKAEDGSKASTYEFTDDGAIRFTSPMWFGSTSPKSTEENGDVSYPVFEKYDPEKHSSSAGQNNGAGMSGGNSTPQTGDTQTSAQQPVVPVPAPEPQPASTPDPEPAPQPEPQPASASDPEPAPQPEPQPEPTPDPEPAPQPEPQPEPTPDPQPAPQPEPQPEPTPDPQPEPQPEPTPDPQPAPQPEPQPEPQPTPTAAGTYSGVSAKFVDAMNSNVTYSVTITFANGSYTYVNNITLSGGMTYSGVESESGTYTVSGNNIVFSGGNIFSGTITSDNVVTIIGKLSSFASGTDSVTVYK